MLYTLFAGYDTNRELQRSGDRHSQVEHVSGFLEEGTYEVSERLRFEFGTQDAAIEATITSMSTDPSMVAAALSFIDFDATHDATIDQANQTSLDNTDTLTVGAVQGDIKGSLLAIDLLDYAGSVPESAFLDLEALTGAGTHEIRAHWDLWNIYSAHGWDESTIDWQTYEANLASGFSAAPLDTQVVSGAGTVTYDVTQAVQRAPPDGGRQPEWRTRFRGARGRYRSILSGDSRLGFLRSTVPIADDCSRRTDVAA